MSPSWSFKHTIRNSHCKGLSRVDIYLSGQFITSILVILGGLFAQPVRKRERRSCWDSWCLAFLRGCLIQLVRTQEQECWGQIHIWVSTCHLSSFHFHQTFLLKCQLWSHFQGHIPPNNPKSDCDRRKNNWQTIKTQDQIPSLRKGGFSLSQKTSYPCPSWLLEANGATFFFNQPGFPSSGDPIPTKLPLEDHLAIA